MGPNQEKIRQMNINRTMHAVKSDQTMRNQENPLNPTNSIIVKKEKIWHKWLKKLKKR